MDKLPYEAPEIEVILFPEQDILTASAGKDETDIFGFFNA